MKLFTPLELLAAEKICLDQLERIFAEPMKPAADAEEFSEQLDVRDFRQLNQFSYICSVMAFL